MLGHLKNHGRDLLFISMMRDNDGSIIISMQGRAQSMRSIHLAAISGVAKTFIVYMLKVLLVRSMILFVENRSIRVFYSIILG